MVIELEEALTTPLLMIGAPTSFSKLFESIVAFESTVTDTPAGTGMAPIKRMPMYESECTVKLLTVCEVGKISVELFPVKVRL